MGWYEAINQNSVDAFVNAVPSKEVANTYVPASQDQEYTPALYLARISPSNAKEMLSHLLALDADLSLLAKTEDCAIRKYCTTIGNLASWSWQEGLSIKTQIMYDSLVELNKGSYKDPSNPIAEQNGLRWKKGWQPCLTTGLGGKWKAGCGIPGISYIASARRGVRNTGIGVGVVAKGVGSAALDVATVLTSPFFLTGRLVARTLRGGNKGRRKTQRNPTSRMSDSSLVISCHCPEKHNQLHHVTATRKLGKPVSDAATYVDPFRCPERNWASIKANSKSVVWGENCPVYLQLTHGLYFTKKDKTYEMKDGSTMSLFSILNESYRILKTGGKVIFGDDRLPLDSERKVQQINNHPLIINRFHLDLIPASTSTIHLAQTDSGRQTIRNYLYVFTKLRKEGSRRSERIRSQKNKTRKYT